MTSFVVALNHQIFYQQNCLIADQARAYRDGTASGNLDLYSFRRSLLTGYNERVTILFLIRPMALVGFKPFGQTFTQFMMV